MIYLAGLYEEVIKLFQDIVFIDCTTGRSSKTKATPKSRKFLTGAFHVGNGGCWMMENSYH